MIENHLIDFVHQYLQSYALLDIFNANICANIIGGKYSYKFIINGNAGMWFWLYMHFKIIIRSYLTLINFKVSEINKFFPITRFFIFILKMNFLISRY